MSNVTAKPVSIAELIDNYARVIEQRDKLLAERDAMLGVLRRLSAGIEVGTFTLRHTEGLSGYSNEMVNAISDVVASAT